MFNNSKTFIKRITILNLRFFVPFFGPLEGKVTLFAVICEIYSIYAHYLIFIQDIKQQRLL